MTRGAKANDPLLKMVEEILEYAKKEGLIIFHGRAPGSEENTVYWNEEHGGDWKSFLHTAKLLQASVLYLDWGAFDESQVEQALAEAIPDVSDDEELEKRTAETEEYKQKVEKYRDKIGLTGGIDIAFVVGELLHSFELSADWLSAFEELTAQEEGDNDEGRPTEEQVDKALVNRWASALANHPKFGSCKSNDQREYLLEGLAGQEYERLPLGYILTRADTLYLFDVRPKEEARLSEQAKRMRSEGLNMNAIAQKLGISKDRVSGLLAD